MLHAAPFFFCLGILVAALGAPEIGVPALFLALVMWAAAVTSAWSGAWREGVGKPLFGPRSVMEEANARMGWSYLGAAADVLGFETGRVRRTFLITILIAAAAAVLTVALGAATR